MTRTTQLTFIAILVLSLRLVASGQTTKPIAAPAAPELEVREWAVFVLDASSGKLNPDGFVQSTLPPFVNTHRTAAPADMQKQPSPVGIIRLMGAADTKVDVKIEKADGTFLASWPKAQSRSNQLLWRDLTIAGDTSGKSVDPAPADWFNRLRQTESAFVSLDKEPAERFLLYDIEMPYPCPLKINPGKDGAVELTNIGTAPLHDLMLYRSDHGTRRFANVGELAPFKPTTQPSTAPTTQPTTRLSAIATTEPSIAPTTAPTTRLSASPTTAPSPQTVVQFTASATTQPADLSVNLVQSLSTAAVSAEDQKVLADIVHHYALESRSLTAVYRLDDAEFDRILPLEVVPQPKKVTRIGIVIIRNADPSAGNEIDELITQLGDPVWSTREAAYKSLKALGPAALPKLQSATKNKDVEIVWRAERLIATAGHPAQ